MLSRYLVSFTNWKAVVSPPSSRPLAELWNSSPSSWHSLFHRALFVAAFRAHLHSLHVQAVWCGPWHPGSQVPAVPVCLHKPPCAYLPLLHSACQGRGPAERQGNTQLVGGCLEHSWLPLHHLGEWVNATTDRAPPSLLVLQQADSNQGFMPRGETFRFQCDTSDTTVLQLIYRAFPRLYTRQKCYWKKPQTKSPKYLGSHTVGIIASTRMELNQLLPAEAILASFIFKALKLKIMNKTMPKCHHISPV